MMKNTLGAIECGGLDARPTELTGNRQRKKYITEYDCANLRLELELWTDSKHCVDHPQDYPLLKSRTSPPGTRAPVTISAIHVPSFSPSRLLYFLIL